MESTPTADTRQVHELPQHTDPLPSQHIANEGHNASIEELDTINEQQNEAQAVAPFEIANVKNTEDTEAIMKRATSADDGGDASTPTIPMSDTYSPLSPFKDEQETITEAPYDQIGLGEAGTMKTMTDQNQEKLDTPDETDEHHQDSCAGSMVQAKILEQHDDNNEDLQKKHDGHKIEVVFGYGAGVTTTWLIDPRCLDLASHMETLSNKVDQLGSKIDSHEITVQGQLASMSSATQTAIAEHARDTQEALTHHTQAVEDRFTTTQQTSDHRFQLLMEEFGQRMDSMASAISKRPGEGLPDGGPEKKATIAVPSPREPQ
jgi:hypothetical protein